MKKRIIMRKGFIFKNSNNIRHHICISKYLVCLCAICHVEVLIVFKNLPSIKKEFLGKKKIQIVIKKSHNSMNETKNDKEVVQKPIIQLSRYKKKFLHKFFQKRGTNLYYLVKFNTLILHYVKLYQLNLTVLS